MIASRSAKITIRAVESLKLGETIRDTDMKGFIVRRQANAIAYALHTRVKGRLSLLTIGKHGSPWTPDSARNEARRLLVEIASGADPAAMRRKDRGQPTIKAFGAEYLDEHARPHKRPASIAADERGLRWHIEPLIGKIRVADLNRADVQRMVRAIAAGKTAAERPKDAKRGPAVRGGTIAANRVLALLSKMMVLAETKGLRPQGTNPCKNIAKHKETKRRRYLNGAEMAEIGKALASMDKANPYFVALIRLLLLTGARRNEIASAQWAQVDWTRAKLVLEESKTGFKEIALPPPAMELLKNLPRREKSPWIIPSANAEKPLLALAKPWKKLIGLANTAGLRVHDLRHSFAAAGVASGLNLPVIGGILGHASAATTKRYAHVADDLASVSAGKIAATIAAQLTGQPAAEPEPIKPNPRKPKLRLIKS
jgi:integrase